MSGLSYHTLDAAKAWSVAWIVLSSLGVLLMFSGRSNRGKASSNLGMLGVLLTLPAEIIEAKLIFGQLTTVANLKMVNDFGPWFSGMRFLGWALLILALVVARTPAKQPRPLAHSRPVPSERSNAPAPTQTAANTAKRPLQQPALANVQVGGRPQLSNLPLILAKCAGGAFVLTCVSALFAPTVVVALYVVVTLVLATAAIFALYASKADPVQRNAAPSTPHYSGEVSYSKDRLTGPIPNPTSFPSPDR
ncbi:hypothetical protein [Antrihabitans stalactiti]|uniref:Uncharacterized protein n=1 Tax=Antrihabitans stalactiti TaxID=2584121 RepID=A0A848K7Y6_9NOCA|nr:hypothetical protein [Antrihabitans stalactiti]NMN95095.1 hypothetical protein [Antrihabitans stalactiti]